MWQHVLQAWIASGKTSIVCVGTNEHNQDCTESAIPVSIEKRLGMRSYAAIEAKISWFPARVNSESTTEKATENPQTIQSLALAL
jgi:hypothetical protein